jgi:branched-chain amino acid aminotransferase
MNIPIWSSENVTTWLAESGTEVPKAYAFYRSDWNAIVTDPSLMFVPVDDHLVHRGDGVFETLLCEDGAVYNLNAHLKRLRSSASAIRLELPQEDSELRKILLDTFRASEHDRSLARVLVGRGPGGFSVDPAESRGASLYVAVYPASPPFMESHPGGARLIISTIPPKSGGLASIKTCNYIPNALSKAEATAQGAHFALGVDEQGFLTESATENVAAVPETGVLQVPPATHHLAGTTLARVIDLVSEAGWSICRKPMTPGDLFHMNETWIVGTTAYVTQAVSLNGKALPTGEQAALWMKALQHDIQKNPTFRTLI